MQRPKPVDLDAKPSADELRSTRETLEQTGAPDDTNTPTTTTDNTDSSADVTSQSLVGGTPAVERAEPDFDGNTFKGGRD